MTALNPNDMGSGITLSNNNLTASISKCSSVRATKGKSTGKWYWEITTNISNITSMIGIGTINADLSTFCGGDKYGFGYYMYNGHKYNNGAESQYGNSYSGSHIIGVAMDLDNKILSFYKDGVNQGIACNNLPDDVYFPMLSTAANYGDIQTINFGKNKFSYSIPTGYHSYDPIVEFLIQDGNNICNTSDGMTLLNINTLPYNADLFKNYGMDDLSNINSTVINKIINQKYNIAMLR